MGEQEALSTAFVAALLN